MTSKPIQTIRYLFLYDDQQNKVSARTGEADAPTGILRKPEGQEIRTQFIFSEPALSEQTLVEHCRRLFDFSEWIITCPYSQLEKISGVMRQFFGDRVAIEKCTRPEGESSHWQQLLNDNFHNLTRKTTELTFELYQIRLEDDKEIEKNEIRNKKRELINKLNRGSIWLTLILFVILTFLLLEQQFNIYAKVTGQELHCYYNETLYPDNLHEKCPERELGDRLFPLINQKFQWMPVKNDSLLEIKLREDSSGIAISLLSDTFNQEHQLVHTNPYLSSAYVMLALKKDYENQIMNRTFHINRITFGYFGYGRINEGRGDYEAAINQNGLKSGFQHYSPLNFPQNFEQSYCDILLVSRRMWESVSDNENANWKSNFQLLNPAITDTIISVFAPLGKSFYALYAFIPSSEIQNIIGIVGVLRSDRTQISTLLTSQWTETMTYSDFPTLLNALRQKEIGVAILPALLFFDYARENQVEDILVTGGAGNPNFYSIALNPAQSHLCSRFNSAMEILDYEVSRAGVFQNFFRSHYSETGQPILEWFPVAVPIPVPIQ